MSVTSTDPAVADAVPSTASPPSPFPLNRVVAFAGPYIAVVSGALADWLLVHVHLLSLFHTTNTQVAGAITQLVVFALTAILVWMGHHKWLTGWQQFETHAAPEYTNGPDPGDNMTPPGVYSPSVEPGT